MVHLKKHVVVLVIIIATISFGCTQEPVGSEYLYFGWIPDGSGLVAVKNNNDAGKGEVCVYDQRGELIKQFRLGNYITPPRYDDRIYFSSESKCFFLPNEDFLNIVNYQTEQRTLLLSNEYFVCASPSGSKIFTWKATPPDTNEFKIFSLANGDITSFTKKRLSYSVNLTPYIGFADLTFLNDSIWVTCYSDSGGCDLTFFNDKFEVIYPQADTSGGSFPRHAANTNKVFYKASNSFKVIDLNTKESIVICSSQDYISSFEVEPNGECFVYSVNEEKKSDVRPGTLHLYNIKSNTDKIIASGISSGGQISPDGKFVAYFTNENKDIHAHICTIP